MPLKSSTRARLELRLMRSGGRAGSEGGDWPSTLQQPTALGGELDLGIL